MLWMGYLYHLKLPWEIRYQLVLGIYGFLGILNEYVTQNDWNCDFSFSETLYFTLLGRYSSP